MTEHDGPGHGEEGHECVPDVIDASGALAGLLVFPHPERAGALTADAWSHGISKRAAAHILRQIAEGWDKDADAEEAEAGAIERAKAAGRN